MTAIGTRFLRLVIGGDEVTDQISSAAVMPSANGIAAVDGNVSTIYTYSLDLTFMQDAAGGSLWETMLNGVDTFIEYRLAPYGNDVADAARPIATGKARIAFPSQDPLLGGASNPSRTSVMKTSVSWPCDAPTFLTNGEELLAAG
jgi:hypothetical protein